MDHAISDAELDKAVAVRGSIATSLCAVDSKAELANVADIVLPCCDMSDENDSAVISVAGIYDSLEVVGVVCMEELSEPSVCSVVKIAVNIFDQVVSIFPAGKSVTEGVTETFGFVVGIIFFVSDFIVKESGTIIPDSCLGVGAGFRVVGFKVKESGNIITDGGLLVVLLCAVDDRIKIKHDSDRYIGKYFLNSIVTCYFCPGRCSFQF